jgi:hypothetical protein
MSKFPKPFNGCIQAIMWKASTSLLAFPKLETADEDTIPMGIPDDVRADALALMSLYVRKDPIIEPRKRKDNGGKPGPPDAEDKDPKRRKGRPPTKDKDPGKGKHPGKGKRRNFKAGSSHYQGATQANNFYWGPAMTAAKAMTVVSGWRRSNEQYKIDRARRERKVAERKRMSLKA